MKITELKINQNILTDDKVGRIFNQFKELLNELEKKNLTDDIIESINQEIDELNAIPHTNNDLKKIIKQKQSKIIKLIVTEMKIVPKNYYRNLWLAIGMSLFGAPLGLLFTLVLKNKGLFAIGIPTGMVIGIALGSGMDKKAFEEGRQLDMEIKY